MRTEDAISLDCLSDNEFVKIADDLMRPNNLRLRKTVIERYLSLDRRREREKFILKQKNLSYVSLNSLQQPNLGLAIRIKILVDRACSESHDQTILQNYLSILTIKIFDSEDFTFENCYFLSALAYYLSDAQKEKIFLDLLPMIEKCKWKPDPLPISERKIITFEEAESIWKQSIWKKTADFLHKTFLVIDALIPHLSDDQIEKLLPCMLQKFNELNDEDDCYNEGLILAKLVSRLSQTQLEEQLVPLFFSKCHTWINSQAFVVSVLQAIIPRLPESIIEKKFAEIDEKRTEITETAKRMLSEKNYSTNDVNSLVAQSESLKNMAMLITDIEEKSNLEELVELHSKIFLNNLHIFKQNDSLIELIESVQAKLSFPEDTHSFDESMISNPAKVLAKCLSDVQLKTLFDELIAKLNSIQQARFMSGPSNQSIHEISRCFESLVALKALAPRLSEIQANQALSVLFEILTDYNINDDVRYFTAATIVPLSSYLSEPQIEKLSSLLTILPAKVETEGDWYGSPFRIVYQCTFQIAVALTSHLPNQKIETVLSSFFAYFEKELKNKIEREEKFNSAVEKKAYSGVLDFVTQLIKRITARLSQPKIKKLLPWLLPKFSDLMHEYIHVAKIDDPVIVKLIPYASEDQALELLSNVLSGSPNPRQDDCVIEALGKRLANMHPMSRLLSMLKTINIEDREIQRKLAYLIKSIPALAGRISLSTLLERINISDKTMEANIICLMTFIPSLAARIEKTSDQPLLQLAAYSLQFFSPRLPILSPETHEITNHLNGLFYCSVISGETFLSTIEKFKKLIGMICVVKNTTTSEFFQQERSTESVSIETASAQQLMGYFKSPESIRAREVLQAAFEPETFSDAKNVDIFCDDLKKLMQRTIAPSAVAQETAAHMPELSH